MPTPTFFRLRDEKQEAIMRAAIRVFTAHGFARAKISDIAATAGVAKGSIYQYFADKEELFIYAAEWALNLFMKKLDARMHILEMDVFEYFEDNVARNEVLDEERELAVFMQAVAGERELAAASMKAMYAVGDIYGKTLIANSRRRGVLRADIDDDLLLTYFLAVSEAFKYRWMERYIDFTNEMPAERNREMAEELRQMLELLRKGMGC